MKTAISIPDPIYRAAETQAKRAHKTRSRLYTEALREYLTRHSPDAVTESMNRALDSISVPLEPFISKAAHRVLERTEW